MCKQVWWIRIRNREGPRLLSEITAYTLSHMSANATRVVRRIGISQFF
jgi:hypothetical protein